MTPISLPSLANHLWQSTLFAAIAGLLTLTMRRNRAQTRYWLWLAASVKFLVPFSLLVDLGGRFGRHTVTTMSTGGLSYVIEQASQPFAVPPLATTSAAPASSLLSWIPVVLYAVWAIGFATVVISWCVRWGRLRAALRTASPMSFPIGIEAMTSPAFAEPGVFGIRPPVLLLPAGITDRLTPAQLGAIIAHELCHIRRRDNLATALHMGVEALFWFHPLVWWLGARLMEERERACDEEVLLMGCEPETYAEGILRICEMYLESPLPCVAGVTGANLKKRIEGIMQNRTALRLNFVRKLLLGVAGTAALMAPVALGVLNGPAIRAQSTPQASGGQPRPAFEVASLKPNKGCEDRPTGPRNFSPSPGRLEMPCVNLRNLIQAAYGTFGDGVSINTQPLHMEGGPAWMQSEYYSLTAKADGPVRTEMLAGPMLQTLLAERFRLKAHRETRQMAVYALTVGKGGLKVQPLAEGACTPLDLTHPPAPGKPGDPPPNPCSVMMIGRTENGGMRMEVRGATMTQLAQRLSGRLDRTVINKTGIAGMFNFHLEFARDPQMPGQQLPPGLDGNAPNPADSGPNLFTAVQEQLGLRLESAKGPVEVLVIDHVERPSEN